jgi:hypothetical protein
LKLKNFSPLPLLQKFKSLETRFGTRRSETTWVNHAEFRDSGFLGKGWKGEKALEEHIPSAGCFGVKALAANLPPRPEPKDTVSRRTMLAEENVCNELWQIFTT